MVNKIKNRSVSQILKWGFVFGVTFGLILLIGGIADYTVGYYGESKIFSSLNYTFRVVGLFVCMILYRNKILNKNIAFFQIFFFGFSCFFIAMLIVDGSICVLMNYFPKLLEAKVAIVQSRLESLGLSDEHIIANIEAAFWVKNPFYVSISFALWVLVVGPFVSFIATVFLMNTPSRKRLKRRHKQKVKKNTEQPSIAKILLESRPEFNQNNDRDERLEK